LGLKAAFANRTLTLNFDLGIDTPATFSIHLSNANGPLGAGLSRDIGAVVPPRQFSLTLQSLPNTSPIRVESGLATQPGGAGLGLCSEWTTVSTAQ
jgi:hypothetical protein